MAEYNIKYLDLRKRLSVLKFLNDTDISLSPQQKADKGAILDALSKELDHRYSETLFLDEVEMSIENLEK